MNARPRYIGFRVILYGPAMTSVLAARSGRTVVPTSLNFNKAKPVKTAPQKMRIPPTAQATKLGTTLIGIHIFARNPITMPARQTSGGMIFTLGASELILLMSAAFGAD